MLQTAVKMLVSKMLTVKLPQPQSGEGAGGTSHDSTLFPAPPLPPSPQTPPACSVLLIGQTPLESRGQSCPMVQFIEVSFKGSGKGGTMDLKENIQVIIIWSNTNFVLTIILPTTKIM